MIEIIKIKNTDELKKICEHKSDLMKPELIACVSDIVNNVRRGGDNAIIEYTKKFDNTDIADVIVTSEEIEDAYNSVSAEFKKMFLRVIDNIEQYQKITLSKSWINVDETGSWLGELVNPIDSVGLYIPGGTAPLISTIAMSAVPAYIAGVKKIFVCTPPDKAGKVNPFILAAAKMARVNKVYKIGGAQAIAAMAYGTATVEKVEKIIGPGNIYVTIAKKLVYGDVNIDMIAGPSEILTLADETANADFIIADLLSQAEHDTLASSYLVTTSSELAEKVKKNIIASAQKLSRFEIMRKSLIDNCRIFLAESMDIAVEIVNALAPEHLELCIKTPEIILKKIKNAGAVFIGNWTPEAVGDYYAGPSHILPTSGTARFYSPVSADTFIKKSSIISYSKEKFDSAAQDVIMLAELEELTAHSQSVKVRLK